MSGTPQRVRGVMLQSLRRVALVDRSPGGADTPPPALAPFEWYAFAEFEGIFRGRGDAGATHEFAYRAGYVTAKDLLAASRTLLSPEPAERRVLGVIRQWSTYFDGVAALMNVHAAPDRTVFRIIGPGAQDPRFVRFAVGWITGAVESAGVKLDSPFGVHHGPSGVEVVGTWSADRASPLRPTLRDTPTA